MGSGVVCIRVKLDPKPSLAGISGMVKIDHFGGNSVTFPLAVAMFGFRNQLSCCAGGLRTVDIDHFPYLQEKLSRRDGLQQ